MTHHPAFAAPLTLPLRAALFASAAVSGHALAAVGADDAGASAGASEATQLDAIEVRAARKRGYVETHSESATRTATPLIDVPQSISVVSGQQLRDQAVQSMADAVRYVPGIGITQGEGNRDGLVFRGNSSTADLFIDGMRDDVQYFRDTYNIERIEAFKGPNAMIFGRGSPGGLLNRVSKIAGWDVHRHVVLQLGAHGKQRATVDVGQALNPSAAFRLNAVEEDSGSFREGVELERRGLNPTLTLRPGDATRVEFGHEYFRDARTADRGIPSDPDLRDGTHYPLATGRGTFFGDPAGSPARTRVDAFHALLEHTFGEGILLRSRLRHADYDKFYRNVFPGTVRHAAGGDVVALSAYDNATQRQNLFSQTDLVVAFDSAGIEHTLLAGIEFGRQETANLRRSGIFAAPGAAPCLAGSTAGTCLVPIGDPTVALPVTYRNNNAGGSGDAHNTGIAEIAAAYVQDQVEFSPRWQALLGLRYDRFEIAFEDLRTGVATTQRQLGSSDGLWSPRAGLVFKPLETLALYAGYGVTHLPRSGEQLSSLTANTQALEPESFRNYEIGAKWDLTPQLSANAAVYRLDRGNAAVGDPTDPARMLLLAGDSQRAEGLELSMAGHLTPRWQVIGSYAWQDARTVQAVGATPAGRVLPQTPRHSAGLWNRFDFTPRIGAALGAVYRDASYASISNAVTLPAYTRLDGALYLALNERLKLQLNIENLLDTRYYPSAHSDTNITPGAPRTAYVSLDLDF